MKNHINHNVRIYVSTFVGMMPGDLVDSSTDSTPCRMMMVHYNTPEEIDKLKLACGDLSGVVPKYNKVEVSTKSGKIDYVKMDQQCRRGQLKPCQLVPIRTGDIGKNEGFEDQGRSPDIQRPLLIAGGVLMLGAVAMLIINNDGCK